MTTSHCWKCGGGTKVETVAREVRLGEHTYSGKLRARHCISCGERTFSDKDLARWEGGVARAILSAGDTSPEAIRHLRTTAGLRAQELATLLDVAPETVSRWENGKRAMDRATFAVMASLAIEASLEEQTTLRRLRALASPTRAPGPVIQVPSHA